MPRAARRYKAGVISIRYLLTKIGLMAKERIREMIRGKKNHIISKAVLGSMSDVVRLTGLILSGSVVEARCRAFGE
jgi:hypothetical protein